MLSRGLLGGSKPTGAGDSRKYLPRFSAGHCVQSRRRASSRVNTPMGRFCTSCGLLKPISTALDVTDSPLKPVSTTLDVTDSPLKPVSTTLDVTGSPHKPVSTPLDVTGSPLKPISALLDVTGRSLQPIATRHRGCLRTGWSVWSGLSGLVKTVPLALFAGFQPSEAIARDVC